jgi:mannose-6-phosphate isomerase-like protein (cupin superfamily)
MAASRKMATATKKKASKIAQTAGKTSARRRIAASKSKPKAKAATKAGSKAKSAPRKQTFVASHLHANAFEGGLRSYAKYRDLGIAAATNGLAQAHVIKMLPPCDPAVVSKRHYHDVDFQMIYVLKGWIKGEYDGEIATMREGSCWLQPPKIKHTVLDYSHDCELLEIILPADFETVELET